jgi:hypothetical protein
MKESTLFFTKTTCKMQFTPLSLSHPAHIKECTLFFTKDARAKDACVRLLRE